ncbi:MBL fold metallo-hydrolase [Herminiimonas fonticola]|uniref:Glyoxylase-like metal-dependent hydrolase (Beta-lactamase superfamily II) n=1 Tax=Herminiimonas fonticola TaxID=303380 RepID=A0A4R6G5P0_9BURK|nr:MBL fold metallo-hydrolase [Herminiimonas fonticola]RBA23742.1 Zn-dependent hydrolases including glyoxylase [Herminiimonas fonticola]TDN89743.1 glyoxylase-like metal-dependent hydrolase (beta-lactamase superfamily II) [Herminiimonas fonticola]
MIFRQLYEPLSSTYTYLLGDEQTGRAILIDPVISTTERDLAEVRRLGLKLVYTVDTHIHADHITGALELKRAVGSKIATPAYDNLPCTDIGIEEGKSFQVDGITLHPLHTPGHTEGHFAYLFNDRVFTGDALLIEGCGRTDFQNGDADALYKSVKEKLFSLPDETLVYPGHDYKQRFVSSIAQEKARNPRLGGDRTLEEFKHIMANLNLPYPKFIDYAVLGNQQCGVCPRDLPENLESYCHQMTRSPQG